MITKRHQELVWASDGHLEGEALNDATSSIGVLEVWTDHAKQRAYRISGLPRSIGPSTPEDSPVTNSYRFRTTFRNDGRTSIPSP